MLGRWYVADKRNVAAPGKIVGVQRTSNQKLFFGRSPRRLEEELLQHGLTIGSISPKVRKVGLIVSIRSHWLVNLGIDAAVQRSHATGSKMLP
jgi:hypothetical protein